jgi:hypothetical protein
MRHVRLHLPQKVAGQFANSAAYIPAGNHHFPFAVRTDQLPSGHRAERDLMSETRIVSRIGRGRTCFWL